MMVAERMLRHKILVKVEEAEPSQGSALSYKTCEKLRFKANKLVRATLIWTHKAYAVITIIFVIIIMQIKHIENMANKIIIITRRQFRRRLCICVRHRTSMQANGKCSHF